MIESIVLGGGCFWCLEAVFQRLSGVQKVESGYAGGKVANPDYKSVCQEITGHAEVVKIEFDPIHVSLSDLFTVFFSIHDPTTLNRQGNDVGTQYRSVIYGVTQEQIQAANSFIESLGPHFGDPIVTEVDMLKTFWPAENYHQNYFNNNQSQPYCQMVVSKKVAILEQRFNHLMASKSH